MDIGLNGRVAIVTGGSSGIGLATAHLLLQEGARVAICSRDPERLEKAEAELVSCSSQDRVFAHICDVTDEQSVAAFTAKFESWAKSCDIVITNAGQAKVAVFSETSSEMWQEELKLKLFSQINPIRALLPLLKQSDIASITAVSSLLAYEPEPHMICTSAARAAEQNFLKSLSREFAPKIRVNSIILGILETGQMKRRTEGAGELTPEQLSASIATRKGIPLGRLGLANEAARAIAFLASPAASYITGTRLEVSGGLSHHI